MPADLNLPLDAAVPATGNSQIVRCGALERMPKWLICVPLAFQWLWLSLRYFGTTLPSCANPNITSGGLVGEGKLEYFSCMGPLARAATAPYIGVVANAEISAARLAHAMASAGLWFPIIAKPDLGLCGFGVRRIDTMAALLDYFAAYPADETVVLQHYLSQDGEAGIFYARDPVSEEAKIIGLALRYFPRVIGDGRHTVQELINADPRAGRLLVSKKHDTSIPDGHIPAAGEIVRLATIGSTRVGGLYRNGSKFITAQLTEALDALARDMPSFYCGRFDVRFDSLNELAQGRGFTIIEVNGAGSEAIHAWDPDVGLLEGFGMIFTKQRMLFSIGAVLRCRGARAVSLFSLACLYRRQQRLIEFYPPSN
ncbi:hypothetical protein AAKU67_004036 [Oxalobacteraceae bacterium GrIS 2.11]